MPFDLQGHRLWLPDFMQSKDMNSKTLSGAGNIVIQLIDMNSKTLSDAGNVFMQLIDNCCHIFIHDFLVWQLYDP